MQKKDINLIFTILGIILVIGSSILLDNNFLSLILTIVGLALVVLNVKEWERWNMVTPGSVPPTKN